MNEYKLSKHHWVIPHKLNTKFGNFSVPKNLNSRRHLAIVHPHAQVILSNLISENRSKITNFINKSRKSRSFYFIYEKRSSKGELVRAFNGIDFGRWRASCRQISARFPVVVKADISRFFYTIYTHSIPWAILGKQKAKNLLWAKKLKGHWSSVLDSAMQACQSRETFGIPVGPDTSRLIAEIILVGLENQTSVREFMGPAHTARLIDDYFVGAIDLNNANEVLLKLRDALSEFNLQLNDDKTEILVSRENLAELWKIEFAELGVSSRSRRWQARHIVRLIETSLHICKKYEIDTPAVWACHRLARLKCFPENQELVIDGLLRLGRDYGASLKYVAEFIVNNRKIFSEKRAQQRFRLWAEQLLQIHVPARNDYEISWVLLCYGALNIPISEKCGALFVEVPSPAILTIIGYLNELGLLEFSFSKLRWRSAIKKLGVNSEYWLPYYESVKRGWTSDKKMTAEILKDSFLSELHSKDVTFIEKLAFKTDYIDVTRRRFGRPKPPERVQALKLRTVRGGRPETSFLRWFSTMLPQIDEY